MNQSLTNLTRKVESLSDVFEKKGHGAIQQVTSSPHVLCFQCRFRGKTYYLYFGRGNTYQGFDFSEEKLPKDLKVQDRFLQFARRYWRGAQILNVTVESSDRVLTLGCVKESTLMTIWFFWRGRDLFFAHAHQKGAHIHLFQSWQGKSTLDLSLWDSLDASNMFSELGFGSLTGKKREGDFSIKTYLNQFKIPTSCENTTPKQKNKNTLEKMKLELERFKALDFLERQTDQDLEDRDMVGQGRFKVSFKGLEGHHKKREHLFNKIKSWRRSRDILEDRITALEVPEVLQKKNDSQIPLGKTIQPIWKHEQNKVNPVVKSETYVKLNYGNWSCFIGRTAVESDQIRKEIAKKEDWWLHLEGMKSGHLFAKTGGQVPAPEDLSLLGSALVELTGQELADIPLIYTQVKNLKGVKGATGMVTYKKEKHLTVHFDQDWRQKLSSIEVKD